ncbi:cuticlin-1-like [Panonychus citri]|uniref:cuticlin-1-like n=1 Tax=Panonychus citri TaxID=50023 RepID=UPI002306DD22|nr:cuticlin-1-like [Panonychus citri]
MDLIKYQHISSQRSVIRSNKSIYLNLFNSFHFISLLLLLLCSSFVVSNVSSMETISSDDVHIECKSNNIAVTINTSSTFNGMIYPKGLSTNSSCMIEFNSQDNVTYVLPLRSCNTMSTDVDDGIEYYNTVVVQPHRKLVTNQGKGYHIRCRYQTKEKTIANSFNISTLGATSVMVQAPMPSCSMKIYIADTKNEIAAENVKIGDRLTLTIALDNQPVYGMKVTNCLVRDGLNWGEQPLLNDEGCPVDEEIMGPFEYTNNLTRAVVSFQAHKFPYTASVYYQCNVRVCLKESGGCDDIPPDCDRNGRNYRRRRRRDVDIESDSNVALGRQDDIRDLSVEVYSGLVVNEAEAEDEVDLISPRRVATEQEFCISMRKFAVGVAIASLLLMLAVILLVACILQRRRRRKDASTSASSIYSGPYSNRAYGRD